MLSVTVVQEIDRLLSAGQLSQRKIAAKLGVSRGTVAAIASGRRGLYGRETARSSGEHFPGAVYTAAVASRCPGCGGFVYMPCVLCRARAHRRRWVA